MVFLWVFFQCQIPISNFDLCKVSKFAIPKTSTETMFSKNGNNRTTMSSLFSYSRCSQNRSFFFCKTNTPIPYARINTSETRCEFVIMSWFSTSLCLYFNFICFVKCLREIYCFLGNVNYYSYSRRMKPSQVYIGRVKLFTN